MERDRRPQGTLPWVIPRDDPARRLTAILPGTKSLTRCQGLKNGPLQGFAVGGRVALGAQGDGSDMNPAPPVTRPPRGKKTGSPPQKSHVRAVASCLCRINGVARAVSALSAPHRPPLAARWREQNPEAAAAINARKRVAHESRACLVCDEEFVPQRVTGRFCSDKCRWRWKYELGRLRKAA